MQMKQLACLLALCAMVLTGCSGGKDSPAAYDPAATAKALLAADVFTQELEELDADMAAGYLGLETAPEEAVVYTSLEGGYEEFAILKLTDEDSAKAALEILQTHVTDRAESEQEQQYKPEDLPKLEKAVVRQAGNTVLLIVAADYDAAEKAILEANQ